MFSLALVMLQKEKLPWEPFWKKFPIRYVRYVHVTKLFGPEFSTIDISYNLFRISKHEIIFVLTKTEYFKNR